MNKNFENDTSLQMNVFLKDGTEYINCDLSVASETAGVCKFWRANIMTIIPWDEIKRVDIFDTSAKLKLVGKKNRRK
jgi:hypothetical protein